MRVDLLDYELPPERIATRPAAERDGARLMVLGSQGIEHRSVRELDRLVPEGALVVVNDTRVLRARLLGEKRESGGRVEIFLVRRLGEPAPSGEGEGGERWIALGRSSKPLRRGAVLDVRGAGAAPGGTAGPAVGLEVRVIGRVADDGSLEVSLRPLGAPTVELAIEAVGRIPLPPYVLRARSPEGGATRGDEDDATDVERYQTVFARVPGAVAAPTAGLHLSDALLRRLEEREIEVATVTLHVGLGTFQPVTAVDLDEHRMHAELFAVPASAATAVSRARERGAPVVAIGTTVVRALESAADPARPGHVRATTGETRLLVQPGYEFRVVDRLLTNFHLPRSTLLALVAAFAGRERVLAAYRAAIDAGYRFYSYGDAMLLERSDGEPTALVQRSIEGR